MKIETFCIITLIVLFIIALIKSLKNKQKKESPQNSTNLKKIVKENRKRFSYIVRFRKPQYIGVILDFHRRGTLLLGVKSFTITVKIYEKLGNCIYGCEPIYKN